MDGMTTEDRRTLIWRLAPIITCLLWIFNLTMRAFVFEHYEPHIFLFSATGFIIMYCIIAILLVFLTIFPYQFYIHAAICWLGGLGMLVVDGCTTNALLIHAIGYMFLYRQGFFRTKKHLKILAGGIVLAAAVASQMRLESVVFTRNLSQFIDTTLIVIAVYFFLRMEYRHMKKQKPIQGMILYLPADIFTAADAEILKEILAGSKYEAIAQEKGLSISTLKKHIRKLFQRLQVSDRITFMSKYAKHQIALGNPGET